MACIAVRTVLQLEGKRAIRSFGYMLCRTEYISSFLYGTHHKLEWATSLQSLQKTDKLRACCSHCDSLNPASHILAGVTKMMVQHQVLHDIQPG
jgi:hypothetical protein